MARFELTLTAEFSAAHQLRLYDGRLEPLHGHNWRVEATYVAPALDAIGVGADFCLLKQQLRDTIAPLHDRCLNELPPFLDRNPSTEHVARHLFERLAQAAPPAVRVARVQVWETSDCAAAYCESPDEPAPRR